MYLKKFNIPIKEKGKIIEKEGGVRNMKRAIEIIYTKLNLHRLMKKGSSLFNKNEIIEISFPFTVSKNIEYKLIKKDERYGIRNRR